MYVDQWQVLSQGRACPLQQGSPSNRATKAACGKWLMLMLISSLLAISTSCGPSMLSSLMCRYIAVRCSVSHCSSSLSVLCLLHVLQCACHVHNPKHDGFACRHCGRPSLSSWRQPACLPSTARRSLCAALQLLRMARILCRIGRKAGDGMHMVAHRPALHWQWNEVLEHCRILIRTSELHLNHVMYIIPCGYDEKTRPGAYSCDSWQPALTNFCQAFLQLYKHLKLLPFC